MGVREMEVRFRGGNQETTPGYIDGPSHTVLNWTPAEEKLPRAEHPVRHTVTGGAPVCLFLIGCCLAADL